MRPVFVCLTDDKAIILWYICIRYVIKEWETANLLISPVSLFKMANEVKC